MSKFFNSPTFPKGLSSSNESWTAGNRAELLRTSVLYVAPVDPAMWVGGLRKCEDRILPCLWNHLLILGLLVFDVTVHRHQLHHRLQYGLKATYSRIIFQGVTHHNLDQGILPCLRYFANYFFYKFGLEVCIVVAVNVIGQRMDVCALLHSFALMAVLARRRRKAIGEVWPKYCCFIASFMVLQYLLCIGLPPALCIEEVLITAMNKAASLEWERQQMFNKNAHVKKTKVMEVPAKLQQSQERMGHAVGGKEQSTHTQVKALKTPQVMGKRLSSS
ncbi:unnamed protein product [Leuciscus chuanchicus]